MSTPLHPEEQPQSTAGDDIRTQLLAGLPVTERRLRLAGISTATLEGGHGRPMVFLHGQGEFAAVWMRVIPNLVTTHRVIVPDLPAHGASMTLEDSLDVDCVLGWLAELIEHTCSVPPVLVGHLLGGAMAARFAIDHGDRLDQLVLVDSLGLGRYWPTPRFTFELIRFMVRPSEHTQDRLFRQCFVDLDALHDQMKEDLELLQAYALNRARTPELQAALRSLMPPFAMQAIPPVALAHITVPTALIWGRHDRQVRLSVAQDAHARYGWPLHVIEDAADDPAFEQPAAFLQALRTALGAATPPGNDARQEETPPANQKRMEVPR